MKRVFICVLVACAFMSIVYARELNPPTNHKEYKPQAGDIILFQTPRPVKRVATRLVTGASITHSAIIIKDTDGELKLLYAVGPKKKKQKRGKGGGENHESGVIIEPLKQAFKDEPDRLFVRTMKKGQELTPEQSKKLTVFAHNELGKPFFENQPEIVTTPATRRTPPPKTYPRYFCSQLVGCFLADMLGKDSRGIYINPEGVTPADLFTDQRVNLSERWNRPVPLHITE